MPEVLSRRNRKPRILVLKFWWYGVQCQRHQGELLVDLMDRLGPEIPKVCYHPQLGPLETCDTCMVEVGGQSAAGLRLSVAAGG